MLKISWCGRVVTGKTERGLMLEQLVPGTMKLSFATPLKVEVAKLNNISVLELERNKAQYRSQLQDVGEEGRKTMRWVLLMEDVLRDLEQYRTSEGKDYAPAIYIDDTRHQDEVDLLHDYGFEVIRLETTPDVIQDRYYKKFGKHLTQEQWDHPSEQVEGLTVDNVWDAEGVPKFQVQAWVLKNQLAQMGQQLQGLLNIIGRK
jgi:hypothetical protein